VGSRYYSVGVDKDRLG